VLKLVKQDDGVGPGAHRDGFRGEFAEFLATFDMNCVFRTVDGGKNEDFILIWRNGDGRRGQRLVFEAADDERREQEYCKKCCFFHFDNVLIFSDYNINEKNANFVSKKAR
jgi:hypothetical protein